MYAVPLAQESPIEDLPAEVIDQLPTDVVQDLAEGTIEKIPQAVIDRLPEGLANQIPDGFLEAVGADPVLAGALIAVGVLAVLFFVWSIFKGALKAAIFAAVVGGGVWFWYFNIR